MKFDHADRSFGLRKKRKVKRTGLRLVAVMVLLICGVVTYRRQELNKESLRAELKIQELNKAILAQEEKAEEIKDLKAYVQTYKYIEEMAREKLGLVYKDEIIFKSEDK